jgi:hypothetical protein
MKLSSATFKISARKWGASLTAVILLAGSAAAKDHQAKSSPQCSIAVITTPDNRAVPTCDLNAVRKLAGQGHVYEQNQLGMASVLAIGPGFDAQSAIKWFEQAARNGYAPAQTNLGVIFANGWGTGQDYGKATSAQTNLGYLYDRGLGVEQNPVTAFTLYRKAAEKGNAMAQNNLADLYLRGVGVAQNDGAAFRWFQRAAQQGNSGASIKLGYMLSEGRGVAKDVEAAYAWIASGDLAGDNRGQILLRSLETRLTKEQIERSKARARQLSPTPETQYRASLQP